MALTFDVLLESEGLSPSAVQLVRHQDTRYGSKKSPYTLWRKSRDDFETYQAIQRRDIFRIGGAIASFVVPPKQKGSLFVGLYEVRGKRSATAGLTDPLGEHDVSGLNFYDLARDEKLSKYVGLLMVDWGAGLRSWVQRAGKSPKPIIELHSKIYEQEFPGYLNFMESLSEIATLPKSWVDRLSEVKGVYVLTCPETKELYVGSATGQGGFFSRWINHAESGGDAVMLRSRQPHNYQISILEVAGSNASDQDILNSEYLWMEKLQTNKMGLNGGMLRNGTEKPITVLPSPASAARP